jgi:hypothetical protein
MTFYNKIYKATKDGDKILTRSGIGNVPRVVTKEGRGVRIQGEWFQWDFFFRVNTAVKYVSMNKSVT